MMQVDRNVEGVPRHADASDVIDVRMRQEHVLRLDLQFLDRAESLLSSVAEGERARMSEWLAWARGRADRMNPLRTPDELAKQLVES